jgi:hypothetical protein
LSAEWAANCGDFKPFFLPLLLQDLSSIRMLQHINHTAIDGCISSDPDVHGLTRFVERCFFIFFWHVFAESSESF